MLGNRFFNDGKATLSLNEVRQNAVQELEEECVKENSIYQFETYKC